MDRATAFCTEKPPQPKKDHLVCRMSASRLARRGLPPLVVEIAGLFDGRRTVGDVASRAQISEVKCAAVVRKLTALGVLEASEPFTAAERSFFATEPGPIDECDEPFITMGDRVRAALSTVVHRLFPR